MFGQKMFLLKTNEFLHKKCLFRFTPSAIYRSYSNLQRNNEAGGQNSSKSYSNLNNAFRIPSKLCNILNSHATISPTKNIWRSSATSSKEEWLQAIMGKRKNKEKVLRAPNLSDRLKIIRQPHAHSSQVESKSLQFENLYMNSSVNKYLEFKKKQLANDNKNNPSSLSFLKEQIEMALTPISLNSYGSRNQYGNLENFSEISNITDKNAKTNCDLGLSNVITEKLEIVDNPQKLKSKRNRRRKLDLKTQPVLNLEKIYKTVAQTSKDLKLQEKLQLEGSNGIQRWSCTFTLKWPTDILFQSFAGSKKQARRAAAIDVLEWLKATNKIDANGHLKATVAQYNSNIELPLLTKNVITMKVPCRNFSTVTNNSTNESSEVSATHSAQLEADTDHHEHIHKLYPSAKNVLHNAYQNVASELKDSAFRLEPVYHPVKIKNGITAWNCTYNVKWPEVAKFTGTGRTKQDASHKAALAVLSWLKKQNKITKDGHPVTVDATKLKEISKASIPPLNINVYSMDRMKSIIDTYHNYFVPNVVPSVDKDVGPQDVNNNDVAELELSHFLKHSPKFLSFDKYLSREKVDLPISNYRAQFLNLLKENQIVIVKGEPGCGKSTRVPQYVLESWVTESKTREDLCRIAVTQPRRLAAISLAERVASERDEQVGHIVGYHVRLQLNFRSQTGRILYCTTAILLRHCQFDPKLSNFSHVIIDEVHERDVNIDLLINLLRNATKVNPNLKIVLMSATMDTELFQGYFNNAPCLMIPGFTYPVRSHYLESCHKLDLSKTHAMLATKIPRVVHEDVVTVLNYIHKNKPEGAILCFLPGWEDISKVEKLIPKGGDKYVLCLHSMLQQSEQHKIFSRPPPGVRKIILATNVAETSVTIDDVVYVVDTGMHKEKRYDVKKGVDCIDVSWVSKSNVTQRKGRAGRCRPGESFHLYTSDKLQSFPEFSDPEILRTSLTKIVLDSKVYSNDMKAEEFMSQLPCPPEANAVDRAVTELNDLSLLNEYENVTPLGKMLSEFPLEPKLSKALINAVVFDCVTPIVDIVTLFSFGSEIFASGLTDKSSIKRTKERYCKTSDHLALMRLLERYLDVRGSGDRMSARQFCEQERLVPNRLETIARLRDLHFDYLQNGIKGSYPISDKNSDNDELVKAVLLSAVGTWLHYRNWDVVNGRYKSTNVFLTNNGQKANITPESVNFRKTKFPSNYLVYINETRSNIRRMTSIRETSLISPLAMLLFSHRPLEIKEAKQEDEDRVTLGLKGLQFNFSCQKDQAVRIMKCKEALSSVYDYYIGQMTEGVKSESHINRLWDSILKDLNNLLTKNGI